MSLSRRTEQQPRFCLFPCSFEPLRIGQWSEIRFRKLCWTASKTAFPEYRTAAIEPMLIPNNTSRMARLMRKRVMKLPLLSRGKLFWNASTNAVAGQRSTERHLFSLRFRRCSSAATQLCSFCRPCRVFRLSVPSAISVTGDQWFWDASRHLAA